MAIFLFLIFLRRLLDTICEKAYRNRKGATMWEQRRKNRTSLFQANQTCAAIVLDNTAISSWVHPWALSSRGFFSMASKLTPCFTSLEDCSTARTRSVVVCVMKVRAIFEEDILCKKLCRTRTKSYSVALTAIRHFPWFGRVLEVLWLSFMCSSVIDLGSCASEHPISEDVRNHAWPSVSKFFRGWPGFKKHFELT